MEMVAVVYVCGDNFLTIDIFQEKSSGRQAHYKLTSTAMLWLQVSYCNCFLHFDNYSTSVYKNWQGLQST